MSKDRKRNLADLIDLKQEKSPPGPIIATQEAPEAKNRPKSRVGKVKKVVPEKANEVPRRQKGFLLSDKTILQFDILKAEQQRKGPDLILEALNLLFAKYGKDQVKV